MKNTIITVIALIVLLVVALYGYEAIFKKPLIDPRPTEQEMVNLPPFDIKEQYTDGRYAFVGTVETPTPCHTLSSEPARVADNSYEIRVTTNAPAPDTMCAQVISEQDFKVSFEADVDAEIALFIDGVEHELFRYEVPEGENIDTFELFIKG